jgi:hypothetical protein
VSTVLPTVIYELGLTGTAVAQLMTMVSLSFPTVPCERAILNPVAFSTERFESLYQNPLTPLLLSQHMPSAAPASFSSGISSTTNTSRPGWPR